MYLTEMTKKRMVGESRFELPTSCSQGRRANQAALLPDFCHSKKTDNIKPILKQLINPSNT